MVTLGGRGGNTITHRGKVGQKSHKVENVSALGRAVQTSLQQADSVSFSIWKFALGSGLS